MQTSVLIRLMLVLGLVAVGGYVLTPTVIYFSMTDAELAEVQKDTANFKNHLPSWSPESHIVPGLDLQGGVHMVLGVDLDKAVSDRARRISNRMRSGSKKRRSPSPRWTTSPMKAKASVCALSLSTPRAWTPSTRTWSTTMPTWPK